MTEYLTITGEETRRNIGMEILWRQLQKEGNEKISYKDFRCLLCRWVNAIDPSEDGRNPNIKVRRENFLGDVLTEIGDWFEQCTNTDLRIDVLVYGVETSLPNDGFWCESRFDYFTEEQKKEFVKDEIAKLQAFRKKHNETAECGDHVYLGMLS